MTARDLQALFAAAGRADPRPDADLVARSDDPAAFAELVRRHGPLVWSVCRRMLNEADAADAFQATFLALYRSAGRVRDRAAVAGWLHTAAVRIAAAQRRAVARRRRREARAARPEASAPVADAAWTAMLAAVHEEITRLPTAERTAFVLCDLQGVPSGEAAVRLGWKPGTLTGRLSRARSKLLARLDARGFAAAAGLVAAGSLAVPAAVLARGIECVGPAALVSPAVIALSREVTAMVSTKHLAAAVLIAGGLLAGTGGGLVAPAGGQPPGTPGVPSGGREATTPPFLPAGPARNTDAPQPQPGVAPNSLGELMQTLGYTSQTPGPVTPPAAPGATPSSLLERVAQERDQAEKERARAQWRAGLQAAAATPGRPGWEHKTVVKPRTPAEWDDLLAKWQQTGWEFVGIVALETAQANTADYAVFKRPVGSPPVIPPTPVKPGSAGIPGPPHISRSLTLAALPAAEAPDVLRRSLPTLPAVKVVSTDQRTNQVVLSGPPDAVEVASRLLSQFDVDVAHRAGTAPRADAADAYRRGMSPPPINQEVGRPGSRPVALTTVGGYQAVLLRHAKAAEVARTVRELVTHPPIGGTQEPALVVSADDRRNLLLFRTSVAGLDKQVRDLADALDVPLGEPSLPAPPQQAR